MTLTQWATKHHVSHVAMDELRVTLGATPVVTSKDTHSEAAVQADVRLEAAQKGLRLFRNNVGVLPSTDGHPVRFGLGNDSPAVNKAVKSGDLIGIRPILITPGHVGTTIGQFVSREIKRPDWKYTGDEREQAQLAWAMLIASLGGDAAFSTGRGSL